MSTIVRIDENGLMEYDTKIEDIAVGDHVHVPSLNSVNRVLRVTQIGASYDLPTPYMEPNLVRVQDEAVELDSGKAEHWFDVKYLDTIPKKAA